MEEELFLLSEPFFVSNRPIKKSDAGNYFFSIALFIYLRIKRVCLFLIYKSFNFFPVYNFPKCFYIGSTFRLIFQIISMFPDIEH